MNWILALSFVTGLAALPLIKNSNNSIKLMEYDKNTKADGSYSFSYEQSDGQIREEQGRVKNAGLQNQFLSVKGMYQWVSPDGVTYTVTYVADENGCRAEIQEEILHGSVAPQIASMLG